MKSADKGANRTLRSVPMTQVSVRASEEMASLQESIAAAMQTFRCSTKEITMAAQFRLRHRLYQLDTATGGSFPKNNSEPSYFVPSALASPPLFCTW